MNAESREDFPAPQQNDEEQSENNPAPLMEEPPNENNPAEEQVAEEDQPNETSPALNETLNEFKREIEELKNKNNKLFAESTRLKEGIENLKITTDTLFYWKNHLQETLNTKANCDALEDLIDRVEELDEFSRVKFKGFHKSCYVMKEKIKKLESSRVPKELAALLEKTEEIVVENKMLKENKIMKEEICRLKKQLEEVETKKAKLSGTVIDFNLTDGNGHIICNGEKIYFNYYGIVQNNPDMIVWSLKKNQTVEFDLIYRKCTRRYEAINVTGPNGQPVQGFRK